MKLFKRQNHFIEELAKVIFRVSSLTFIVAFGVEYFLPGFVTNWFNPVWLLLISLISVIIVSTSD